MNKLIKTTSLFLLASPFARCTTTVEEKIPPNVLVFLTDDQGWGDLGIHGNKYLQTPNLDQFFAESTVLSNFYVNPVCAPSRAALLTGRYNLRTGASWVTRGTENMRTEEVTIAEIFREEGYQTGMFGKWHNGSHYPQDPNGQGFDEFWGFCAGHWSNYFDTDLQHNQEMKPTKGYITDVLTEKAMQFISAHKEKPFFCFVPYNTPHTPFQVADKYFDKYKNIDFGKGIEGNKQIASVYGMVENMDENIGRMLQHLEQLGLEENTIVVFLTDNGPQQYRYNGALSGRKTDVLDGGIKVPFAIRWPNHLATQKLSTLAAHIDVLPTLLDLCQVEKPKELLLDGISLSENLKGENTAQPERIFFDIMTNQEVVADYKGTAVQLPYKWMIQQGEKYLYHLENDASEQFNLIDSLPEKAVDLERAYQAWFTEVTKQGFEPFLIPVGYKKAPITKLEAHEARLSEHLKYKHSDFGWAHDWVTHWQSEKEYMEWEIEVIETTLFDLQLNYTCQKAQIGSEVLIEIGDHKIKKTIETAFTPVQIKSPDRASREQEAYEQTWGSLSLGALSIPKGIHTLRLSAPKINGQELGEIKAVQLIQKENYLN